MPAIVSAMFSLPGEGWNDAPEFPLQLVLLDESVFSCKENSSVETKQNSNRTSLNCAILLQQLGFECRTFEGFTHI